MHFVASQATQGLPRLVGDCLRTQPEAEKKDFCLLCMFTTNMFIFSCKDGSKANTDTFDQFVFSTIQQCLH